MTKKQITAVLFDLDGTLLDTAADLTFALNLLRQDHALPELPAAHFRDAISFGSKALLRVALNIEETHPDFKSLRQRFFDLYQQHLTTHTTLFPQIEEVLDALDQKNMPWGIVTNKRTQHTLSLLAALHLKQRAACIICGDTLAKQKPDPLPITHACHLLAQPADSCLYVGDAITDVAASKAAGTQTLVALYGYISKAIDPYTWEADGYVHEPREILQWL